MYFTLKSFLSLKWEESGRQPSHWLRDSKANLGRGPPANAKRSDCAVPQDPRWKVLSECNKIKRSQALVQECSFPLTASKILQQVWEDENTKDLGLNNAPVTWASGQAEVGGQGSQA